VSFKARVRRKIEQKEKSYEIDRLMKEKRSEEYETLEEVFDRATLMTVYDLMNKGEIGEIHGAIKAGKESKIYFGRNPKGEELAIKIYLTGSAEFKKGMLPYIIGDPRFKNVKRGTRSLIYMWARKEFKNLHTAYEAKVRVPKPFTVQNNVLIMEFIGKDGVSAPLLRGIVLENPERVYKKILLHVKRLYRDAKLVHGDLSEYNVMMWKGEPVIFDFSQAVSLEHPNAAQFLMRDLQNLYRYFARLGVDVLPFEETFRRVTGGATAGQGA
jgi:RIO kinase 1